MLKFKKFEIAFIIISNQYDRIIAKYNVLKNMNEVTIVKNLDTDINHYDRKLEKLKQSFARLLR